MLDFEQVLLRYGELKEGIDMHRNKLKWVRQWGLWLILAGLPFAVSAAEHGGSAAKAKPESEKAHPGQHKGMEKGKSQGKHKGATQEHGGAEAESKAHQEHGGDAAKEKPTKEKSEDKKSKDKKTKDKKKQEHGGAAAKSKGHQEHGGSPAPNR
jgi:hypothetical protein